MPNSIVIVSFRIALHVSPFSSVNIMSPSRYGFFDNLEPCIISYFHVTLSLILHSTLLYFEISREQSSHDHLNLTPHFCPIQTCYLKLPNPLTFYFIVVQTPTLTLQCIRPTKKNLIPPGWPILKHYFIHIFCCMDGMVGHDSKLIIILVDHCLQFLP